MTEVRRAVNTFYVLDGGYCVTEGIAKDKGKYFEAVLASDYDALAARVQAVERLTLANEMLKGCLSRQSSTHPTPVSVPSLTGSEGLAASSMAYRKSKPANAAMNCQ